jgi:hypothetical protein
VVDIRIEDGGVGATVDETGSEGVGVKGLGTSAHPHNRLLNASGSRVYRNIGCVVKVLEGHE